MTIFARILLLVPMVLAGCGAIQGVPGPSLDGRTFLSTDMTTNGQPHILVAGTQIRLNFDDGQFGASAGCNIYGATYSIRDGHLVASGGSMTEMGCDEDRAAQDEWLFGFLGSNPGISLDGDRLVLAADGTIITLLDREVADPDLPLVGPTWTVASIISGDAVSTVSLLATIAFQADGRVTLNTSCNSGGGQYEATGDELRFSDLVTTERDCEAPAGEVETAMLRVLQAETVNYQIEAGNLTLRAGGFGLQLTGR